MFPFLKRRSKLAMLAIAVPVLLISFQTRLSRGQEAPISKETQLKLLKLEESGVALKHAIEYDQTTLNEWLNYKNLSFDSVVTGKEVSEKEADKNEATQKLELAVVDLQKTFLSLLQEATHLTITDAYQFIDQNNDRHMKVTIMNTSSGPDARGRGGDNDVVSIAFTSLEKSYELLTTYLGRRSDIIAHAKQSIYNRRETRKSQLNGTGADLTKDPELISLQGELTNLDKESIDFSKKLNAEQIKRTQTNALMTIEDLYVSVTAGGVTISTPFEQRIAKLARNESRTIDFKLTQEADQVTVNLNYQNVKDQRNIRLEKRQTEDVIRVNSNQFAQEGKLGAWVEFDIKLSRMAEDQKTFAMDVVNLPSMYKYEFTSQGNQLSRVKFEKGVSDQALTLRVLVPDNLADKYIKKAVSFYVVVGEDTAIQALRDIVRGRQDGVVNEQDFNTLKIGYEALDLTPRGTGQLEITFQNLYHEIKTEDKINDKFTIKNTGTARLDRVQFKIEKPGNGWDVVLKPPEVTALDPDKDKQLEIQITPPKNVDVGKYEIKIKAASAFEGSSVETEQKTITVQIFAKTNLKSNVLIIAVLVVVVLAVAIFTIKLSRR